MISAVVLFLPLGTWIFYGADRDGVLTAATAIIAVALGAGLMAYPVILLRLKDKPFFRQ